jgi:hypothetical protein
MLNLICPIVVYWNGGLARWVTSALFFGGADNLQ